jgi:dienelactone hydrolase
MARRRTEPFHEFRSTLRKGERDPQVLPPFHCTRARGGARVLSHSEIAALFRTVGVWGMGLLAMMQPAASATEVTHSWGSRAMRFTLSVKAGSKTLTSTTFTRQVAATTLTTRSESFSQVGFVGRFVYPAGATRRPAVLLLGGSEGGLPDPLSSEILAAHGYPVLALAYFELPGLPRQLLRMPLEYFERALQWLRRQPQVDPKHIAVLGASRGSEAALLSGAHFPRLVDGVIALDPSAVAICSYPGCLGPAWTLQGHAVPFICAPGEWRRAAVIPVQRIRGPVFLACGTADRVGPSCAWAHAIIAHLNAAHDRFPHLLYAYAGAGHSVGTFTPYDPTNPTGLSDDHPQANQQARSRNWPRLLDFLAAFGRTT